MKVNAYPGVIKLQLVLIILFGALFLGLFKLDKSIWIDEDYSIYITSYNLDFVFESLKTDTGPPLYYLLLFLWIKLFGMTEIAVRSLSVLLYCLSIIVIYYAATVIFKNKNIGLISSALYALSPLAFGHGQTARMYSLLGLLSVTSMVLFFKLFFDESLTKRNLFFYVLINIFGTFTHYWYVFALFSHFTIFLVLSSRRVWKIFLTTMVLSVLPFLLLWAQIALAQMKEQKGKIDWMVPPTLKTLLDTFLNFYSFKENIIEGIMFYLLIALMALLSFDKMKIKLREISEIKDFFLQKVNIILITFISLSLLTPFFISQYRPIFMPTRQPILVLFAVALILGALLEKFVNRNLVVFFLWCLLLMTSLKVFNARIDPTFHLQSNKSTSEYLMQNASKGDYMIFTSGCWQIIRYYFRLAGKDTLYNESPFPREITDSDPIILANQAKSIVEKINIEKDKKVWVIAKKSSEKDKILIKELENKLELQRELDLQGNFHDVVYVYKKKPGALID